jgi:hypothetical protein
MKKISFENENQIDGIIDELKKAEKAGNDVIQVSPALRGEPVYISGIRNVSRVKDSKTAIEIMPSILEYFGGGIKGSNLTNSYQRIDIGDSLIIGNKTILKKQYKEIGKEWNDKRAGS